MGAPWALTPPLPPQSVIKAVQEVECFMAGFDIVIYYPSLLEDRNSLPRGKPFMDVWGQLKHFYYKYLNTKLLYDIQNTKAEINNVKTKSCDSGQIWETFQC